MKKKPKEVKCCSIADCKNQYVKKGFCSTHYKKWRKETIPGYGEHVRSLDQRRKKANPEKQRIASRRYNQKNTKYPKPKVSYDITESVSLIMNLKSLFADAEVGMGGSYSWRIYLNNLIEDESILDYEYDPETNMVTIVVTKLAELCSVIDFHEMPPGVQKL